jgi:hypothetical protein
MVAIQDSYVLSLAAKDALRVVMCTVMAAITLYSTIAVSVAVCFSVVDRTYSTRMPNTIASPILMLSLVRIRPMMTIV